MHPTARSQTDIARSQAADAKAPAIRSVSTPRTDVVGSRSHNIAQVQKSACTRVPNALMLLDA